MRALAAPAGVFLGACLAAWRGPLSWPLLAAAAAAALALEPVWRVSRLARGWGEAVVALAYGPGIVCGTYWLQARELPASVWLASIPYGLLVAAFLWTAEFPDYDADSLAGRRNWVVRLGRPRAAKAFGVFLAAAAAVLAALPLAGLPPWVLLGLSFLIPGAQAAWLLLEQPLDASELAPAQALTAASFTLLAAATGCGLLLARWLAAA